MIRWATEADRPAILRVLDAAGLAMSGYDYRTMDGATLVEVHRDEIGGYVRFDLGRPETHIRQLVVAPMYHTTLRGGGIAKALLDGVIRLSLAYQSQGIEGFQREDQIELLSMVERLGAYLDRGVRVRWPLTDPARGEISKWIASASTAWSPSNGLAPVSSAAP